MQNAFQNHLPYIEQVPANDTSAESKAVEALSQSIKHFSDEQIALLEDEIDFFAFTGLIGKLLGEVLHTSPTANDDCKISALPEYT